MLYKVQGIFYDSGDDRALKDDTRIYFHMMRQRGILYTGRERRFEESVYRMKRAK